MVMARGAALWPCVVSLAALGGTRSEAAGGWGAAADFVEVRGSGSLRRLLSAGRGKAAALAPVDAGGARPADAGGTGPDGGDGGRAEFGRTDASGDQAVRAAVRVDGSADFLEPASSARSNATGGAGPVLAAEVTDAADTFAANASGERIPRGTPRPPRRGKPRQRKPYCKDSANTAIRIQNGLQEASCRELAPYCKHPELGKRVRKACRKSCGYCDIELDSAVDGCVDRPASEPPIIKLKDKSASCQELAFFCTKNTSVFDKCKVTCGACARHVISATTATTTTLKTSCSRRRMMGFCATRRRRMA